MVGRVLENSDFYESLYLAAVDPIVILELDFVIPQMTSVTLREMPTLAIHASTGVLQSSTGGTGNPVPM